MMALYSYGQMCRCHPFSYSKLIRISPNMYAHVYGPVSRQSAICEREGTQTEIARHLSQAKATRRVA
jgi:hypothetical protein